MLQTGLAALVLVVSGVTFWQNLSPRAYPPAFARLLGWVERVCNRPSAGHQRIA